MDNITPNDLPDEYGGLGDEDSFREPKYGERFVTFRAMVFVTIDQIDADDLGLVDPPGYYKLGKYLEAKLTRKSTSMHGLDIEKCEIGDIDPVDEAGPGEYIANG